MMAYTLYVLEVRSYSCKKRLRDFFNDVAVRAILEDPPKFQNSGTFCVDESLFARRKVSTCVY